MARLVRRVSASSDDAGELASAPFDPIFSGVPLDGSLEVGQLIQSGLNNANRLGQPRKFVFPPEPARLWSNMPLSTYLGAVHDGPTGNPNSGEDRTFDIDFNGCQIWWKMGRVKGRLAIDLPANAGAGDEFFITPLSGSFTPPAGVTWPAGASTSGWPTGSGSTTMTTFDVMFNPSNASDPLIDNGPVNPYSTRDDDFAGREVIRCTSRGPTGNCLITSRGGNGGTGPRLWRAGTIVEWIQPDVGCFNFVGGHDINFWNFHFLGPGGAEPAYIPGGRAFQHGLTFAASDNVWGHGTLRIARCYGDWVCSAYTTWSPTAAFPRHVAGKGNPATNIRVDCSGLLSGSGRQGFAPGHVNGWRMGPDVGDLTADEVEDLPDSEMLVCENSNNSHSVVDMEPEGEQWIARDVEIRGARFKDNGRIHATAGPGTKDGLGLVRCHFVQEVDIEMTPDIGDICAGFYAINCVGAPGRSGSNESGGVFPAAITLVRCAGAIVWGCKFPRSVNPANGARDNYGCAFVEVANPSLLNNDFGNAKAGAAILVRSTRSATGANPKDWKVGQIVGNYPPAYGNGRGRPFSGDVYSGKRVHPGNSIPGSVSSRIGPVIDTTGITIPSNTTLRISAGGQNTGPQVFYTSQYGEQRVAKSAIRCDHGGDNYRDRPPQQGNNQVGDFWGDPFPSGNIPLPPRPLPGGQWVCPAGSGNPNEADGCSASVGDWWVVVVDETARRSYEFSNGRWDGTIWHCNWGACYDLDGDGVTTLGTGSGTGSGLSQLVGLVRAFELANTRDGMWVDHSLVTPWANIKPKLAPGQGLFRYPANSTDGGGSAGDNNALPEGLRFLIRVGLNLDSCTIRDQKIIHSLRTYPGIVMDQGGSSSIMFFAGEYGLGALASGTIRTKTYDNATDAARSGLGLLAHWDGGPRKSCTDTGCP